MLQVEQFDILPGSIVYKVILLKDLVGTYILDLYVYLELKSM